jgi:hypothetical protein
MSNHSSSQCFMVLFRMEMKANNILGFECKAESIAAAIATCGVVYPDAEIAYVAQGTTFELAVQEYINAVCAHNHRALAPVQANAVDSLAHETEALRRALLIHKKPLTLEELQSMFLRVLSEMGRRVDVLGDMTLRQLEGSNFHLHPAQYERISAFGPGSAMTYKLGNFPAV